MPAPAPPCPRRSASTLRLGPFEHRRARVQPGVSTLPPEAGPIRSRSSEPPAGWPPWSEWATTGEARLLCRLGPERLLVLFCNRLLVVDRQGKEAALLEDVPAPVRDVTAGCVAPDGTIWLASRRGAVALRNGRWLYFGARRYLADNDVREIACGADGVVWVLTATGVARLEFAQVSLAEKAALFEERLRARHCRHGYVTSCALERPGDPEDFLYEASDNDGLWTAIYVAAESFRCAATGSGEARRYAAESLQALLNLERRTPICGFPARALVRRGERVLKSGGEWHDTEDGEWEWKGDTSSDELDGHFFAYGVYHDLVADDREKAEIAEVVGRIADHLIEHGLQLVDLDGRATRWGVLNPERLHGSWREQCGLNSLEILAGLRGAHHICREPRYLEAYRQLVTEHGYDLNLLSQKLLPPDDVNHSDDELAFLAYYSLLTCEDDPELRRLYLLSLERSWRMERPERNPLWSFIYGALSGNDCDTEVAVATLAGVPLEQVDWSVHNSHRDDLRLAPHCGRHAELEATEPLPADERPLGKWNSNPYRLDSGGDGRSEDDGAYFLLPYWMGRYYGFIEEAQS